MTEQNPIPIIDKLKDNVADKIVFKSTERGRSFMDSHRAEYEDVLPQLEQAYNLANTWHGTGRKQYREDGDKVEIIDVLEKILVDGGLKPHRDIWDAHTGVVDTVSLAKSRMYSRAYAEQYSVKGEEIVNPHGSQIAWMRYFISSTLLPVPIEVAKHYGSIRARRMQAPEQKRKTIQENAQAWVRKTTREPATLLNVFSRRSDIPGNYPMLFGYHLNLAGWGRGQCPDGGSSAFACDTQKKADESTTRQ